MSHLRDAGYRVDTSGPNPIGEYLVTTIDRDGRLGPQATGPSRVAALSEVVRVIAAARRTAR